MINVSTSPSTMEEIRQLVLEHQKRQKKDRRRGTGGEKEGHSGKFKTINLRRRHHMEMDGMTFGKTPPLRTGVVVFTTSMHVSGFIRRSVKKCFDSVAVLPPS